MSGINYILIVCLLVVARIKMKNAHFLSIFINLPKVNDSEDTKLNTVGSSLSAVAQW